MNQFWKKEEGIIYDEERRKSASTRAVLYYLVSCYIIYMGVCIIKNRLMGDDSIPLVPAIVFAVCFVAGGFFIMWYATRRLKWEFAASVIQNTSEETRNEEKS